MFVNTGCDVCVFTPTIMPNIVTGDFSLQAPVLVTTTVIESGHYQIPGLELLSGTDIVAF